MDDDHIAAGAGVGLTVAKLPGVPHTRIHALILAAGAGTRLRPLTEYMAKCLVPIAGRPLLEYWLDALVRIGVRDIWVNSHAHPEQMRALLARMNARVASVRLHEVYEPELLGSAGTIAANPDIGVGADAVIVIYADNLSTLDLGAMRVFHQAHAAQFTMALFHAPNPRACGIAELGAGQQIVAFTEKPQQPAGDLANAGVYFVSAQMYREIAALHAFDMGFDVIPRLLGRMHGYLHTGYHRDIGTPEAYARAQADAPALLRHWGQDAAGRRRAVFFDRDGTLIEHVHYLDDPADVSLVDGCGVALRRLRDAGFALVIVTNQTAVGKGLLDEATLTRIHQRMFDVLADQDVCIDALYYCPVAGEGTDRTRIEHPDRKPGPGMLLRAADELNLCLARSYMLGDMISDVLAGEHAGCRASLLLRGTAEAGAADSGGGHAPFDCLGDAVDWILADAAVADALLAPSGED